jgi:hypothetical protein
VSTTDRLSTSHQRWTLSIGGRTISGFHMADRPENDVETSRFTPAGGRGDVAVSGFAVEGGTFTLTHTYDARLYKFLQRQKSREGRLTGRFVDADGRTIAESGETFIGIVKGVTPSNYDAKSADKAVLVVRFEADGAAA